MPRDEMQPAPGRAAGERRVRALDALLLASAVVPALLFGLVATYDRAQALATAERDLLATLDTLHGHAEKVFQFQALALGTVDERLRGLSEAQILAEGAAHHAHLRALQRHAGEALGLAVFGTDGRPLLDSNMPQPPRHIDVSDREYFRWHRENPGPLPFVGAPFRSRAAGGAPTFFISMRRSQLPGGDFAGVIAVGIRQASLVEYWDNAAPAPGSLVVVFRRDGTILARRPAVDPEQAPRVPPEAPLMHAVAEGRERQPVGGVSPLDGTDRIFAYRRIARFPDILVAHGVSREAALEPWRRRMMVYGAFAVVVSLALSSLALLARRRARALAVEVRERRRAEAEVRELNAGLERRIAERTAEIERGEAQLRLLAREVDHRAKNALAVVQAALRLTPREDAAAYARAVEGRVAALARAQTLLSHDAWRGASLRGLLEGELAPFLVQDPAAGAPTAALDGPAVLLPATATQPIAMAAHELATNALKYGALSVPGGHVQVTWHLDRRAGRESLRLRWAETGGPTLAGEPGRRGFGSRVLSSVITGQLGGRLALAWAASGLICDVEVPIGREEGSDAPGAAGMERSA